VTAEIWNQDVVANTIALAAGADGFSNRIVNPCGEIDQLHAGAADSGASIWTVDRWKALTAGTGVFSVQRQSSGGPAGVKFFVRCKTTTAEASPAAGSYNVFYQPVEGTYVSDLDWGSSSASPVTLSFQVRIHSAAGSKTLSGSIVNDGNARSYPFTVTVPTIDTWTLVSVTIPGDIVGTWLTTIGIGLRVYVDLGTGSTYRAAAGVWAGGNFLGAIGGYQMIATLDDYVDITAVQLVKGSSAPTYAGRDYGEELRLCKRRRQKSYNAETTPGTSTATGIIDCLFDSPTASIGVNAAWGHVRFGVEMASAPSVTWYSQLGTPGRASDNAGVDLAAGSATLDGSGPSEKSITVYNGSAGAIVTNGTFRVHFVATSEL
jgi:hypothetical protein